MRGWTRLTNGSLSRVDEGRIVVHEAYRCVSSGSHFVARCREQGGQRSISNVTRLCCHLVQPPRLA